MENVDKSVEKYLKSILTEKLYTFCIQFVYNWVVNRHSIDISRIDKNKEIQNQLSTLVREDNIL